MNCPATISRSIFGQALCVALVFILGGSLFTTEVMGSDACGMMCCCQTGPSHIQSSVEKHFRSPVGCCSGIPLSPCDMQSAKPLKLPEIILASYGSNLPSNIGLTNLPCDSNDHRQPPGRMSQSLVSEPPLNAPPLFLQHLTLLI
jgi:hypothetical protein